MRCKMMMTHLSERRRCILGKAHRDSGARTARRAGVYGQRIPCGHARGERPSRNGETANKQQQPRQVERVCVSAFFKALGKDGTYALPVHCPEETVPLMTSQYVPAGRDVVKIALQAVSALLMAMKPREPRGVARRSILTFYFGRMWVSYLVQRQFAPTKETPSWSWPHHRPGCGTRPYRPPASTGVGTTIRSPRRLSYTFPFLRTHRFESQLHHDDIK